MMDPMRGNNGPRYKHQPGNEAPYETISVDKLTPIIGAEIGGIDLSRRSATTRWRKCTARWRKTW